MTKAAKKTSAKKPVAPAKKAEAYLDHHAGSRKGEVHRAYDSKGKDAAMALGEKTGLKTSTLRKWFSRWGSAKPAKKVVAKRSTSRKAAPAQASA